MASPGKRRRKKMSGIIPEAEVVVETPEVAQIKPTPKSKPKKKKKGFFDKD